MKRLGLLAIALCALVVVVPAAETAPTSDVGCTVEHLSGAPCQGPDASADADACEINTWVGDATCTLTVSDGVASSTTGFVSAYSALQDQNWHAEFHVEIRDAATGQVLFTRDGSSTVPVSSSPLPPAESSGFSGPLSTTGGSEVICVVTGTHTPAGAPFSAAAAAQGQGGDFNNAFNCDVN